MRESYHPRPPGSIHPDKVALYRAAGRAAWVGLLFNLSLGAVKLVGGVLGSSFALVADAVNSLGDALVSGVVIFALRVAQKPPDAEHPYGHTRAEAIAASNIALIVLISALWLGWEALSRLDEVHASPPWWALGIAGANAIIKEGLYRYKAGVGKRTGSMALIANAWDHRADALAALAVLVGLLIVRVGGPSLMFADEVAALVVVLAILIAAFSLFRRAAHELLDPQAEATLLRSMRKTATGVPGVKGVEKLWVRKSGLEYLADIHVEVEAGETVAEGHQISHRVKDALLFTYPELREVLVHLEPHQPAP